jgi:hypothetical protein
MPSAHKNKITVRFSPLIHAVVLTPLVVKEKLNSEGQISHYYQYRICELTVACAVISRANRKKKKVERFC